MAKPMPDRRSSSRRVSEQWLVAEILMDLSQSVVNFAQRSVSNPDLVDIHHLVGKQQQLGVLLPGAELGGRDVL